jgi:hypothetical protein
MIQALAALVSVQSLMTMYLYLQQWRLEDESTFSLMRALHAPWRHVCVP